MISKRDVQLGKIALKQGMIDKDQLTKCLALKKKLAKQGKKVALGSLLIKKNYLTKDQLETIVALHNERVGDDDAKKSRRTKRAKSSKRDAEDAGDEAADARKSRRAKRTKKDAEPSGDEATDAKKPRRSKSTKKVAEDDEATKRRSRRSKKVAAEDEKDDAEDATATKSKRLARAKRARTSKEARKSKRTSKTTAAASDIGSEVESAVDDVDPAIFQSAMQDDVETGKRRLIGCPECGKKYRVRAKQVGKRFKCRRCKYRIKVPKDLFDRTIEGPNAVEVEEFVLASSDQSSDDEVDVAVAAAAVATQAVKKIGAKTSIRELAAQAEKHQAKPLGPKAKFGIKQLATMAICLATAGGMIYGVIYASDQADLKREQKQAARVKKEFEGWQEKVDAAVAKAKSGGERKDATAIGSGLVELGIAREAKRRLVQGNNQEAATAYEQAQDLDGLERGLLIAKGRLVLQKGGIHASAALGDFIRAASYDPAHEESQLILAETRVYTRQFSEAARGLEEVAKTSEAALALQGLAWEGGDAGDRAAEAYAKLKDPLAPVLEARALVSAGNASKALAALARASGLEGADQAALLVVKAMAQEAKGDMGPAMDTLAKAIKTSRDTPFPLLARGELMLRLGKDPKKALDHIKAGNRVAGTARGYFAQGEAQLAMLRLNDALSSFREASNAPPYEGKKVAGTVDPYANPLDPDFRVMSRARLAFYEHLRGQLPNALGEVARGRNDSPFSPEAQAAFTYVELLQPDRMLSPETDTYYRRALELNSRARKGDGVEKGKPEPIRSRASAYVLLVNGALLLKLSRYDPAISELALAAKLDPSLAAAALALQGEANRRNNQVTSATYAYREASRLESEDPAYQEALRMAASSETSVGRLEEAANALLVRNPHNAHAYVLRARVRVRQKKPREALADMERAIALNPQLGSAYAARGFMFLRDLPVAMRNHNQAGKDFDMALAVERAEGPKMVRAETLHGKASYHFAKKELDIAEQVITDCILVSPNFAPAYELRAKVFEAKGQKDKAQKDRQRYQKLIKAK